MKLHITLDMDDPRDLAMFKDYFAAHANDALATAAPAQTEKPHTHGYNKPPEGTKVVEPERVEVGDPQAATLPPVTGAEPDISLSDMRSTIARAQAINLEATLKLLTRVQKDFEVANISEMDGSQRATLMLDLTKIIQGSELPM